MSVLEKFFQISVVFLIITVGMDMTLNVFGHEMTGMPRLSSIDANATSWNEQKTEYESSIRQSSSAPSDLPTDIAATLLSPITLDIYEKVFALQITIYQILHPYGLDELATLFNAVITFFQGLGIIYLGISIIAIIRGAGGTWV